MRSENSFIIIAQFSKIPPASIILSILLCDLCASARDKGFFLSPASLEAAELTGENHIFVEIQSQDMMDQ